MKKLVAGLFTAILTTAGFVAVTSSVPAHAQCTGYVCNSTATNMTSPKSVTAGKAAKVRVMVTTRAGNVEPRGDVILTVDGPGGYGRKFRFAFNGDRVVTNLGKLTKPGRYKLEARFFGDEGFLNSSDKGTLTVKKDR